MRTTDEETEFASWLLKLGNDALPSPEGLPAGSIAIPPECVTESVADFVYGSQIEPTAILDYAHRVVLCPTNDECFALNTQILQKLKGESICYRSIDSVACDDPTEADNYPVEFLHGLTPSGMPVHHLELKIGTIIVLLRNLNTLKGLCNGTRMVIRQLMRNFLDVEVLTGPAVGERSVIPRIDLAPSDTGLPFTLRRRQFPIAVAFAMTINKAQGQTFDRIGLYLASPVFSHGQLYVAFSRVRRLSDIKVQILNGHRQGRLSNDDTVYTLNVVFREVI
jgi:hypothetical protein